MTDDEQLMDRAAFLATLPRRRLAAGALIRDESGRVCIVEPTCKPLWHLPGGTVEAGESARLGCRREVQEELGLDLEIGHLLVLDWIGPESDDPHGALILVYDGGVLTPAQIDAITLPVDELSGFDFIDASATDLRVNARNLLRIRSALSALADGSVVELHP